MFCLPLGMGNTESAKQRQRRKELLKQMDKDSKKINPPGMKNILLLHCSDAAMLEVVVNFNDALITKTNGSFHVKDVINVADGYEMPHNMAWLASLNNVVLICLAAESIDKFKEIILQRGFVDEKGCLHEKVFTVSFGETLTSLWPPKGLKKGSSDLRDFFFGFSDVEKIRTQDFAKSLRLNSLIAAIKATI